MQLIVLQMGAEVLQLDKADLENYHCSIHAHDQGGNRQACTVHATIVHIIPRKQYESVSVRQNRDKIQ